MARVPSRQPVVAGGRFPKDRAAIRYPIHALAEASEPVSRRSVTGWTSLVSLSGCYVRASDALPAGTIVQLRIQQAGRTFETWARVVDMMPNEGMGLAFFDTAEDQRELLKKWFGETDLPKENPAT
jgi:hypothetical protein